MNAAQNAQDIADLIASVYRRARDRDDFVAAMEEYGYLKKEKIDFHMLFYLCNDAWLGGYVQGTEEEKKNRIIKLSFSSCSAPAP